MAASDAPSGGWPSTLGPFWVRGRWQESEAGSVLAGVAPDGRQVELVLLGPGPASDAATRDRFAAAVDSLVSQHPGAVLDADPRSPWPWVALSEGTSTGSRPAAADGIAAKLLAAAVPPGAQAAAAKGPEFSPYWRGRRHYRSPVVSPAAPARSPGTSRTRWWLVAALLFLLFLLLIWWLLSRPLQEEPMPPPTPLPTITQLPPPAPSPSPFPPFPGPRVPPPTGPSPGGGSTALPAGAQLPAGAHQG